MDCKHHRRTDKQRYADATIACIGGMMWGVLWFALSACFLCYFFKYSLLP